jgi:hypothetical protein
MLCYHTSEMSCPYFDPLEPHPRTGGATLALMPLGGTWTGTCHADPQRAVSPDESALHRLCNMGYARGVCPRFPAADPGPDAARFTLSSDDGATLRIYYVLERDHQPFAHGPLEFAVRERAFIALPAGNLTARQAAAYAASYLERKSASLER